MQEDNIINEQKRIRYRYKGKRLKTKNKARLAGNSYVSLKQAATLQLHPIWPSR